MKVRFINWKNVTNSCSDRSMKKAFDSFYLRVSLSDWSKPQDIIQTFNHSDLVSCGNDSLSRIVFNIGSNKYRLICGYSFGESKTILYVKFVGTHSEYDKIDVCDIDMFKNKK